jgi:hypothetical protein
MDKKLILVIGGTGAWSLVKRGLDIDNYVGAQGLPVIKSLLSTDNNAPSPYAVRVLTRDPSNPRSQDLKALGCDVVKGMYSFASCTDPIAHGISIGSLKDLPSVQAALQGVYGAFVNTDGFTIGEKEETYAGLRIYEMAKQLGVKHYVWSSLDYMSKVISIQLPSWN